MDIDKLIEEVVRERHNYPLSAKHMMCDYDTVRAVAERAYKKGALDCNDEWLADNTVRDAAKADARRELAREIMDGCGGPNQPVYEVDGDWVRRIAEEGE